MKEARKVIRKYKAEKTLLYWRISRRIQQKQLYSGYATGSGKCFPQPASEESASGLSEPVEAFNFI